MTLGRCLVTGGRGFIGARLVAALRADGVALRVLTRGDAPGPDEIRGDLADPASLARACAGIDTVFHCAGHAHAFGALGQDEAARHRQVNLEGTRALAEAAGGAGVRRFVFLSSVKAMGEPLDTCVDEDWRRSRRRGAYGQAKRAAEDALQAAAGDHGMHAVSLRLAMVYGAGGRGNLERMAALVAAGRLPAFAGDRQQALAGACVGRGGGDPPGRPSIRGRRAAAISWPIRKPTPGGSFRCAAGGPGPGAGQDGRYRRGC